MIKELTLVLAMWAGMFGPSLALAQPPPVPPHHAAADWSYVCDNFDYSCAGVSPPRIEWVEYVISNGGPALGGYDGTDAIYMNMTDLRFADTAFVDSIIVHEMAHYLDVQTGLTVLPFTWESVCQSEMRGWRVGNAYVATHGRPDLADFTWHMRYGCFQ